LFDHAASGGAQALQRESGVIAAGKVADFIALDACAVPMLAVDEDRWLDAWITLIANALNSAIVKR